MSKHVSYIHTGGNSMRTTSTLGLLAGSSRWELEQVLGGRGRVRALLAHQADARARAGSRPAAPRAVAPVDRVRKALQDGGSGMDLAAVMRATGLGRSQAVAALQRLLDGGEIVREQPRPSARPTGRQRLALADDWAAATAHLTTAQPKSWAAATAHLNRTA